MTFRAKVIAARIAVLAILVAAWYGVAGQTSVGTALASPSEVIAVLGEWASSSARWGDLISTLQSAALGWVVGLSVAVLTASALFAAPLVRRSLAPLIAAANATPTVALAPLFVLWFGLDLQARVYFVSVSIFFFSFFDVSSGLASIDRRYRTNARVLGASGVWVIREVYGPAVGVWVMSTLRVTAALALVFTVVSEYLAADRGIGVLVARAQSNVRADHVIAGIVVIAVVAVIVDRALLVIERRVSGWRLF